MYVKNSAGPFIDGPDFGKKNRALRDLDADFFCESKMTFVTFQGSGKLEIDRGRTAKQGASSKVGKSSDAEESSFVATRLN